MTFIITLISLIIERFFHWRHFRQWHWFNRYQLLIGRHITKWPCWAIWIVFILPLLVVIALVNFLLDNWLYGLPKIIFGVLILVYCMGPENLWVQTVRCINELHNGDTKGAIDCVASSFNIPHPSNSQAFHQALTSAIFIEAHRRMFAVIFWFVVLGPVGAVLYRSIDLCSMQSDFGITAVSSKAHKFLDWIPARIFTLIFALGGHFQEVLKVWKKDVYTNINMNESLIAECGLAALDKNKEGVPEDGSAEKDALELLDRVFVMGLLILAMIVIMLR